MKKPQEADIAQLIHDQPEFLIAVIAALLNKTGQTHIRVTQADVIAATNAQGIRMISNTSDSTDVYLVTQPSERHVGLDYADPIIPPDVKN